MLQFTLLNELHSSLQQFYEQQAFDSNKKTTNFQTKTPIILGKVKEYPSIKQNVRTGENSITFKAPQTCIIFCAERCREVGKGKM